MSRGLHVSFVAAVFAVCVSTTAGQIENTEPFEGDLADGFETYGMLFEEEIDFFEDNVTVGSTFDGLAVFVLQGSSLNGVVVLPRSGGWLMGVGAPAIWVFHTPVQAFGGYFATNSGAADATAEFFDANDDLIGTRNISVDGNKQTWRWNGWTSTIPIHRILITGNGINNGFIDYDDMEISFSDSAPEIVHDGGMSTTPFSGYVDPRSESDNGVDLNLGIDEVTITFTVEVFSIGGGPLDASDFAVNSTGAGAPAVISVDAKFNPQVVLTLDGPIAPGSWYTITAAVQDALGNVIASNGDEGPGVDEPDRVDIAFLPADVDQSGGVTPFDLLRFRQIINDVFDPPVGVDEDYVDTDRSGAITPFDLLAFRQLVNGISPATQPWAGAVLDAARP